MIKLHKAVNIHYTENLPQATQKGMSAYGKKNTHAVLKTTKIIFSQSIQVHVLIERLKVAMQLQVNLDMTDHCMTDFCI